LRTLLLSFTLLASILSFGQELKSPSEFLGYELGTQFTRHHEVVDYYQHVVTSLPDQVQLHEYGKTNERRPLLVAYISSAENMAKLENIRSEHLKNTIGEGKPNTAIVWLSYNVHGNESVSTEASMQTLYDLLTTKKDYLKNTVVIIDPCINPDGRDRYVNWYNQYKNSTHNVDPNSKEHHEPWQSGRANHYMFDLNRDWAWLTQVESQQRLKYFNKWLPHVHVDFHEQGVDNPYYFAPAAEPFHEVITDFQRDFQKTIGKNHAKYFDKNGWFYFTKEVFDLLYPSYGDTYPTYNGGIGMTYEQGGSGRAGLGIVTSIGDTLTLKDRIAHHHTTGLSTVEVAAKNAKKLNAEFKKFYQNKNYKYKSYVLNGNTDKINALKTLLDQHEIAYGSASSATVKGYDYKTGSTGSMRISENSLVVSGNQSKSTLVKVLFEPKAKLTDSVTYDITAWSLPYAYGLDAIATSAIVKQQSYDEPTTQRLTLNKDAYAFLTDWNKPFTMDGKTYKRGSLIITRADNKNNKAFLDVLSNTAFKHNKTLTPTATGFVEGGKDFGSGYVQMIPETKIAVLSGEPTSTLRFGEIWHFFEQQLEYPVAVIDGNYMNQIDLSDYDALVLPGGWGYRRFMNESRLKELKEWVANGGKLIAMGSAIKSICGDNGFGLQLKENKKDSATTVQSYESGERDRIKGAITGAIFKTKVDTTHPLAFGYSDTYFLGKWETVFCQCSFYGKLKQL